MQTIHANGLQGILHPGKDKKTGTERALANLGRSSFGTAGGAQQASPVSQKPAAGLDSFTITQQISELLSPACGMSEEEKASYLAKIMAKLKSGKRLTAEEMRFLQAENPILYQQAARIQAMRESLETRLQHCTSKEEAEAVYASALSSVAKDDPLKEYLIAAYDDVYKEFRDSDGYQSLPQKDPEEEDQPAGKP